MTEPAGAGAHPAGVGACLREAREAQGLAVDDVAQQLKFAPRQIESLEHERFDRLPGPTIARGMVRNYARLLKLDPEPLIQRMGPQTEKAPDPGLIAERFRQEVSFSDGARRSTLIYAGFSIGLLVLVGALAYEWREQKAAPEFVAPAREQPAPAQAAAAIPPKEAAPLPAAPAIEEKKPEEKKPEEKKPEEKKPEEKKPQAAVALAKPAAEPDKPAAAGLRRIVLRCEEEAWVEVKDASGRTLISALSPAGTERVVRGQPPFELVIGNANSVRLTYEGKPVDLRPHIRVEVARLRLQ